MTSVERLLRYTSLESEAALKLEPESEYYYKKILKRSPEWPKCGKIEFEKVCFRYREGLENTLKGIDMTIQGGEKVGCVGRTGAGKSSMIQALFRMCELAGGKITIDGEDISKLGLNFLRSNLSIIPQTPTLFIGNIKYNVDPLGEYSDDQIWDVLEEVQLMKHVTDLKNGLKTEITSMNSGVFSDGQK